MSRDSGAQLGLQLRDAALDRFEGEAWLAKAREAARALCGRGEAVTIDDVQAEIGPPPRPNMAGGVFRVGFQHVGYTTSSKPEGHGNKIGMWRLA